MTAHLFDLGTLAVTPNALALIAAHTADEAAATAFTVGLVERHVNGDYGDVHDDDRRANDRDAASGGRVMSAYEVPCRPRCGKVSSHRVWVITDPGETVVLLPEDY